MSDRMLRGGLVRLIVYRPDTGAALDIPAVLLGSGAGQLAEDPTRTDTAAGSTRVERWDRSIRAVVTDQARVEQLKTWQRDGAKVRALSVGMRESAHRVWYESVRIDLQASDAGYGGLVGHTLTLSTARYDAAVALSDDLNALASWRDTDADGIADDYALYLTGGDAAPSFTGAGPRGWQSLTAPVGETVTFYRDIVLPAPGLRVRLSTLLTGGACGEFLVDDPGDDARVAVALQAYTFGPMPSPGLGLGRSWLAETREEITAEGEANAWLTLPAKTYTVRMLVEIQGGTAGLLPLHIREPHLFTRAEAPGNVLNGGFLYRGESVDTEAWVIEAYGTATDEEATTTLSFRGTDYASESYTLGPAALLDLLAADSADPAEPYTVALDTRETC